MKLHGLNSLAQQAPCFMDLARGTLEGKRRRLRLSFPFSTFYEGAQNVKKPASATQAMFKEEEQQKFYL